MEGMEGFDESDLESDPMDNVLTGAMSSHVTHYGAESLVRVTKCVIQEVGTSGEGSVLLPPHVAELGLEGADAENMMEDGALWAYLEFFCY